MADDQRLNDQMDQLLNHPALRMQRSVIAGFGVWIGVRFGATILVYATVQILAQIEFIPILGNWAIQLIEQIEMKR